MKFRKLSVVIPVYNEERFLPSLLKKIEEVKIPLKKEIIIVDDFSSDRTREILKRYNRRFGYKILYNKKNYGKGFSLIKGFKKATGDIFLVQDADLEYNPEDYNSLLKPILDGDAEVVYGSRFLGEGFFSRKKMFYPFHYLANKLISFMMFLLYFKWIDDVETCYKVMTREIYKNLDLKSKGFEFEIEITSRILQKHKKIFRIPIDYSPRTFKEGKKIKWTDGVKAFFYLFKYRLL